MNDNSEYNKSVFINLVCYKVKSKKIYYRSKPVISKRIAVCLIVPVASGDFLGTFLEALYYTKQGHMSISDLLAPVSGLWLDRSKVSGKLSHIKIAKTGKKTNVCLV